MAKPDFAWIEDVAGVSAEFHQSDQYRSFYDRFGEGIGGFPAIWGFAGVAGDVFHEEAVKKGEAVWEENEWIDSIMATVRNIYEAAFRDPDSLPLENNSKAQRDWLRRRVEFTT